jgi:hypothetical protein
LFGAFVATAETCTQADGQQDPQAQEGNLHDPERPAFLICAIADEQGPSDTQQRNHAHMK